MLFKILFLSFIFSFLTACGGGGGGVQPTTYPAISLSTSHASVTENSGTTVTLTVPHLKFLMKI